MSAEKTKKVYKSAAEGAFLFPKRAEKRAFLRAAADWKESAYDKERGGARKSCPRNERRKKRAGGGEVFLSPTTPRTACIKPSPSEKEFKTFPPTVVGNAA